MDLATSVEKKMHALRARIRDNAAEARDSLDIIEITIRDFSHDAKGLKMRADFLHTCAARILSLASRLRELDSIGYTLDGERVDGAP